MDNIENLKTLKDTGGRSEPMKVDCYHCANLTAEAKTSFLAFDILDNDPCKLHKMPKKDKKCFGRWICYDLDCKFFKPESIVPINKCSGCGFSDGKTCFLHSYPTRKWARGKCGDYDKNAWEVKAVQTKAYKRYNKNFSCRMGYGGLMPLSWRMSKGVNCSLCDMRDGDSSCPLTNGYLLKTIEIELKKE